MNELPSFSKRPQDMVQRFAVRAFTHPGGDGHSDLLHLIAHDDGHYRALFAPAYFILSEGQTEPSKSQWNTLKKKLKRLDKQAFVFKEHGTTEHQGKTLYYLDFGFLKLV